MKILALELSSGQGSIAWMEEGRDLFVSEFANDRKHSGLFFENLQRSIAQFGKADRIVVGLGPGSYAGTRIAIATALGLQAATGAELIGLPSLCAMPTDETEFVVIGDARRQSFFFARVLRRRCVEGPVLCTQEELVQRLAQAVATPLCRRDTHSTATERRRYNKKLDSLPIAIFSTEPLPAFSTVILTYPSARILAQIAATQPARASSAPLEPLYLREPHITWPKAVAT